MTLPTPAKIARERFTGMMDRANCEEGALIAFHACARELRKHRDIINGISVEELDKIIKQLDGEKVSR